METFSFILALVAFILAVILFAMVYMAAGNQEWSLSASTHLLFGTIIVLLGFGVGLMIGVETIGGPEHCGPGTAYITDNNPNTEHPLAPEGTDWWCVAK